MLGTEEQATRFLVQSLLKSAVCLPKPAQTYYFLQSLHHICVCLRDIRAAYLRKLPRNSKEDSQQY